MNDRSHFRSRAPFPLHLARPCTPSVRLVESVNMSRHMCPFFCQVLARDGPAYCDHGRRCGHRDADRSLLCDRDRRAGPRTRDALCAWLWGTHPRLVLAAALNTKRAGSSSHRIHSINARCKREATSRRSLQTSTGRTFISGAERVPMQRWGWGKCPDYYHAACTRSQAAC